MGECQKEFATLIRATLHYLKGEQMPSSAPLNLKVSTPIPAAATPPEPKPAPSPQKITPPKPSLKWELNSMPLPPDSTPQFTNLFQTIPLTIPIYLFVSNPSQILFLQGVARALTQHIAPATLFEGKLDALLTNQSIQLVLAPLSILQKRFPQVDLHEFHKLSGPTLLPIAGEYDPELKKRLWHTLKSFKNTPLSS